MGIHQHQHQPERTIDPGEPSSGRRSSPRPYASGRFQASLAADALAPIKADHLRTTTHISLEAEVPEVLFDGMRDFITSHPDWDQYSVITFALAGFLFQNGSDDRAVTEHYLNGLFPGP